MPCLCKSLLCKTVLAGSECNSMHWLKRKTVYW